MADLVENINRIVNYALECPYQKEYTWSVVCA